MALAGVRIDEHGAWSKPAMNAIVLELTGSLR